MFDLAEVVPWGRSLAEYRRMFALTPADEKKSILGCADGPASFNAELSATGGHVVSGDPLYRYRHDKIAERIDEVFPLVIQQTAQNQHEFVWGDLIPNIAALSEIRQQAMADFLKDYEKTCTHNGKNQRYADCELPRLPFPENTFELALCSHFLFLYSKHHTARFHIESIVELTRVASEVRIFPLQELGSRPSRHLNQVITTLRSHGFTAKIERVNYEFQQGGNQMLRVYPPNSSPIHATPSKSRQKKRKKLLQKKVRDTSPDTLSSGPDIRLGNGAPSSSSTLQKVLRFSTSHTKNASRISSHPLWERCMSDRPCNTAKLHKNNRSAKTNRVAFRIAINNGDPTHPHACLHAGHSSLNASTPRILATQ